MAEAVPDGEIQRKVLTKEGRIPKLEEAKMKETFEEWSKKSIFGRGGRLQISDRGPAKYN